MIPGNSDDPSSVSRHSIFDYRRFARAGSAVARPAEGSDHVPGPDGNAKKPHLTVATVKLQGGSRISKLIGSAVYNDQNEKIGSLNYEGWQPNRHGCCLGWGSRHGQQIGCSSVGSTSPRSGQGPDKDHCAGREQGRPECDAHLHIRWIIQHLSAKKRCPTCGRRLSKRRFEAALAR
jgi:hypothetical protein